MNKNDDAGFLVARARTQLIINQPFFGALCLRLRLCETDSIPTMATDGRRLMFNPEFVRQLAATSTAQLLGVICHEIMHCACGHMTRLMGKDERGMKRLIATDIAINPIIRDCGLAQGRYSGAKIELPPDAIFPAMFGFEEGLTAEEYYRLLKDQEEEDKEKLKKFAGMMGTYCDGCRDAGGGKSEEEGEEEGNGEQDGNSEGGTGNKPKPLTQSEIAQLESEWSIAVTQAAQAAKAAGKLPAGLERLIDELRAPKVDWRDVLRRFVSESSNDDYRMLPPNRRYVWQGMYMPSMHSSDNVGECVIAFDMSGSVGQREMTAFFAEFTGVCEDTRPGKIHVVSFDTEVYGHTEFTREDYPITADKVELKGGGGTSFFPIFKWIAEEGIEPKFVIVLTDMYGDGWPLESDVPWPVLWAATSDVVSPMGETVRVEIED